MSGGSVYRKQIISIFGPEFGPKILSLVDPCSVTPEDCEMIKACETLTSITYNNSDPLNLIFTYKDEKGKLTNITVAINPAVTALDYIPSPPMGGDNLFISLSDGSQVSTLIPVFKFVPVDGIATSMSYNSTNGIFVVNILISTDDGNLITLGTDGGLLVNYNTLQDDLLLNDLDCTALTP